MAFGLAALKKNTGSDAQDAPQRGGPGVRIAYDVRAFGGSGPSEGLQEQFPEVSFSALDGAWTSGGTNADLVIIAADAATDNLDALAEGLKASGRADRIMVVLSNADLTTIRRVMREGAADVLPAPVTEPSLAASLERVLARLATDGPSEVKSGAVIAFLKAGGGVGATALASQLATLIADNNKGPSVCLVDFDVQFGAAAMYLDLPSSVSLAQVVSAGGNLSEMQFSTSLKPHSSGARVLAAPPEFMPLDALNQQAVDGLITALKREFEIVILDLPLAWTAWTYRALRQADKIVLVTQLTVPHAHLTKRQLRVLESQRLSDIPVTLVCNRCGGDNPPGVAIKQVEAAIGKTFDVVIPEDRRLMNEAINQGVALGQVRRGSKIEKALSELAGRLAPVRAGKAKRG